MRAHRAFTRALRFGPLVGALAGLLLLAGCGSSDNGIAVKTPAEILAATIGAAQKASSVRVASMTNTGTGEIVIDATYAKDNGHARVSLLGIRFETIRIGEAIYARGGRAFARQLERALGLDVPPNTWLKGSTTGVLAQLAAVTEMKAELPVLLTSGGTLTKGTTTTIHGQSTIELKKDAKLYTGTLYVATSGQPYPVLLRKTAKETGETKFTDWNEPVTVTPPANAVELSQLHHEAG